MKRNLSFETTAAQAAVGLTPSLVRLSVGVERADDLLGDLAQGLRKAMAVR